MSRLFLLDTTGILALFAGEPRTMTMLRWAEQGTSVVATTATAVVAASRIGAITSRQWDAVLLRGVFVIPFDETAAFGVVDDRSGRQLDVAHTMWEARRLDALVVTRQPQPYRVCGLSVVALPA